VLDAVATTGNPKESKEIMALRIPNESIRDLNMGFASL
jgi:hypothetical protein